MHKRVNISVPEGLFRRLEDARGDVPRSLWVVRALESALANLADVGESKVVDRGGSPAPSRAPAWREPPPLSAGAKAQVGVVSARELALERQRKLNEGKR